MVNKEKLNKLYEVVIDDQALTTKKLNEIGFNANDITKLIQDGILARIKRGEYRIIAVESLYNYGVLLSTHKEYARAKNVMKKCIEIDSNYYLAYYNLFNYAIYNSEYDQALQLYASFAPIVPPEEIPDLNLFLYLLSYITDLPEEYKIRAKKITYADFKSPVDDYIPNQIRSYAYSKVFSFAFQLLNDHYYAKKTVTINFLIVKALLKQAVECQTLYYNTIDNLITQKDYNGLIKLFEVQEELHRLIKKEKYMMLITQKIIEVKNTKIIPEIKNKSSNTIFEAIDNNDFHLALQMQLSWEEQEQRKGKPWISIILTDLCNVIDDIKRRENTSDTMKNSITYTDIISLLMQKNVDQAIIYLKEYLSYKKKSDLIFLISGLIQISLCEKDFAFIKPMSVLALIDKNEFLFDPSQYLREFYICLSKNSYGEAKIYLDILAAASKIGLCTIPVENLYQTLPKSKSHSTNIEPKILKEQKPADLIEPQDEHEEFLTADDKAKVESAKTFIAKKRKKLIRKEGIILLKRMPAEKIDRLLEAAKAYSDIDAFVIQDENKLRIVLRYKPRIEERLDIKGLMRELAKSFRNDDYDNCIKIGNLLLKIFSKPNSYNYEILGMSYLKKSIKNKQKAIDYLIVANYLAKKEGKGYNFDEFLMKLRGQIEEEDYKPQVNISDMDYNDIDNFYGISDFVTINNLILSSGMDVESICLQLGFTLEQIDIIKLIYAREFYISGYFEQGDLFLRSFEKSKNKTAYTINIANEIMSNKRFYQYRQLDQPLELSLKLKASKN